MNKRGFLVPASMCGSVQWIRFAQLCGQEDRMEERGISVVSLSIIYLLLYICRRQIVGCPL